MNFSFRVHFVKIFWKRRIKKKEDEMAFYKNVTVSEFISDVNFEQLVITESEPEAMYWKDLPINIVYRLDGIFPIQTKLSKEILLQLSDKDGYVISVWSPSNLKKALKSVYGTTYTKSLEKKNV